MKNNNDTKEKLRYEIPVAEVHKVVQYLKYAKVPPKFVKFCPRCFMCNVSCYNSTRPTGVCDICFKTFDDVEKELFELDTESFALMVTTLPLKNNGQILPMTLQEIQQCKDNPRSYDDLTQKELDRLDDLIDLNL